jgi:hypothetical protein
MLLYLSFWTLSNDSGQPIVIGFSEMTVRCHCCTLFKGTTEKGLFGNAISAAKCTYSKQNCYFDKTTGTQTVKQLFSF